MLEQAGLFNSIFQTPSPLSGAERRHHQKPYLVVGVTLHTLLWALLCWKPAWPSARGQLRVWMECQTPLTKLCPGVFNTPLGTMPAQETKELPPAGILIISLLGIGTLLQRLWEGTPGRGQSWEKPSVTWRKGILVPGVLLCVRLQVSFPRNVLTLVLFAWCQSC